ncbi:MAG: DUF3108 domain-containing protein [Vicingaceae bacterium]
MRAQPFIFLLSILVWLGSTNLLAQETYRKIDNRAFVEGEKSEYLVHYGPIDAGIATLEIKKTDIKVRGRELLHIVGTGKSRGITDLLFHVDDHYETYIDKQGIFPWLFIRKVSEGGYNIEQTYKFFQNKNKVETQKGVKHDVPPYVHDMISAAMFARTLDLTNSKKGDTINVVSFVDDELFDLMISYAGKEDVKIRSGTYYCHKFNPIIQVGRIFNTAEDLEIWVSADENKIPILCKAKILVGSVKVELLNVSGLANPLSKLD